MDGPKTGYLLIRSSNFTAKDMAPGKVNDVEGLVAFWFICEWCSLA